MRKGRDALEFAVLSVPTSGSVCRTEESGHRVVAGISVGERKVEIYSGAERVYVACGYTDLRKGIDGLSALVQRDFESDPCFCSAAVGKTESKGLYWEGDGFVLLYKRLEQGIYQWPRSEQEAREITPQQYRWLMGGLRIEQPKAHRPVTGLSMK